MSKKREEEQLNMGLRDPFFNRFKILKYRAELFFAKLRTNSLFTAPFLWMYCALVISLILVQIYYYSNFIDRLPKEVPLFSIANNPELALVSKESLLWVLVLSIILSLVSVIVSIRLFYRFKFISVFIMTNLALSISFLTISYIKIFGIYIF